MKCVYRKVMYISRGFDSTVAYMQSSESAKRVKAVWHMYSDSETLQKLQNCFKCERIGMHKAFGMQSAVGF